MNSALKPVLPAGGQSSPAKGNVASANHNSPALAQGAQNSHVGNSIGQNLSAHNNASAVPPHAVPSMAPVPANMVQMAQNMSHHGNLSHVSQNSATPTVMAASPNKSASTSSPLSLVQDKPSTPNTTANTNAPALPLALTRTPEKKEPDSTGPANGTIESPKSAANAPPTLKPPNTEINKEKQDIAKTSPSTPKPPEKPSVTPSTPQKAEPASSVPDGPAPPKVVTASEAPEKSPSKPVEVKPAPTADIAPTQSDSKPVPESANNNQAQEKPTQKEEKPIESARKDPIPAEPKKEEAKVEAPATSMPESKKLEELKDKIVEKTEPPKKEEVAEKEKPQPSKHEDKKDEDKKPETKPAPAKAEKTAPKSTLKLATVTTPVRKRRQTPPSKADGATPAKKSAEEPAPSTPSDTRTKRNRTQVQLYQSPTPELTMATKLSASAGRSTPTKPNEDKLIVFYKNEFLAVRNAEGGFYVCQAMQNVYRTTRKIKIRWLSQDKTADPSGETYKPDFYDVTDMECVLTTLSLQRAGGGAVVLRGAEHARACSILQRALAAERAGAHSLHLTEEHPDGLDLSLYTDESQLEKKSRRRRARSEQSSDAASTPSPAKKARTTPKRSPKSKTAKPTTSVVKSATKTKQSPGTKPVAAPASKTATAVSEKSAPKPSTAKASPAKKPTKLVKKDPPAAQTPTRKGRRAAAKEVKQSPATPVPSTSTGKATRTPRKPPSKK